GLGHITRDLAIARELRRLDPEVDISWLACPPATDMIEDAGEKLLPEAEELDNENRVAEWVSRRGDFRLNIIMWAFAVLKAWAQHILVFRKIIRRESFDLLIGDETYALTVAFAIANRLRTVPYIAIYDSPGWFAITRSPLERLGVYFWNCVWISILKHLPLPRDPVVFIGEEEDIPNERYGILLPNRRVFLRSRDVIPVGYILPFDLEDHDERDKARARLGYGGEPLVVASSGGTAVGGELLELCGQAFPIVREAIPDLRMVLVCGPRLYPASLSVPEGVEVKGYVPALHEHFAACDLAIIHGGGTSTVELTALRRPFIFFPLEGHFEQQVVIANRLARQGAGVKLSYPCTTPQILAEHIISNIGREVTWPPIPTDGAQKTAQIINDILDSQ
ncbi:MAG: hypothetical protein JW854_00075, partial [Actinobacteria bacterium]|nr:hypothetical protein [Actinomycetota bacterium]